MNSFNIIVLLNVKDKRAKSKLKEIIKWQILVKSISIILSRVVKWS